MLKMNKNEDSTINIILAPFHAAKQVFFSRKQPTHVSLVYMRNYLRLIGLWPSHPYLYSRAYYICNLLIMTLLAIFIVTIACDLYEASSDIILFGEDVVILMGLCLIYFKIWNFRFRAHDVDAIISEFDLLHKHITKLAVGMDDLSSNQRLFFLGEVCSFSGYICLGFFFFAALAVQPLVSNQSLPLRAKFPFGLHDSQRFPLLIIFPYIFQCFCIIFNLFAIIILDNIGCHCFSQTTINLRALCSYIRAIRTVEPDLNDHFRKVVNFHQRIIRLIRKINKCYYWNYISQMGASMFIICLTAFEALLAQDQPVIAMKFQIYMVSGLLQLFYWCWMGNMTYFSSTEVSNAAFEIHKWYEQSLPFQNNLIILILRAQKPLVFRANPFYAFTFETFSNILSSSYSYFALLRNMNN